MCRALRIINSFDPENQAKVEMLFITTYRGGNRGSDRLNGMVKGLHRWCWDLDPRLSHSFPFVEGAAS